MTFTRTQRLLATGAACLGVAAGAAGIAGAATNSSTSSSSSSTGAAPNATAPAGAPQDPAPVPHGPGERVLNGATAAKVTAAARAAVPGGTVLRVETDSEGSPYEAHVRKADGTYVTVKIDSSFEVSSTIDGFGQGPAGHGRPGDPGGPGGDDAREGQTP